MIRISVRWLAQFLLVGVALTSPVAMGAMRQGPVEFESLESARAASLQSGKPVVIIFAAVWCSACREFAADTLPTDEVHRLAPDFHWVRIDVDRDVSVARAFEVLATPTILVENSAGEIVGRGEGALSAQSLERFLEDAKAGANHARGPEARPMAAYSDPNRARLTWSPTGYRGHSICFSHVGFGPLDLPSQAPGQVLRLGVAPRTPSTLAAGEWEIGWTESLANVFSYSENDYRLDYGTLNSVLSLAYGATDTMLFELEYSDLTRFDSVLDPITTAFHDAFGFGDSGRDEFSEGDNALFLAGQNGDPDIENDTSGSLARDIGLTFQHNLTCGTESLPAVSYSLTARYHAGGESDLTGDYPWSFGASVALSRRFFEEIYTYGALSYAVHGMDQWNGLELRDTQISGFLAFEWRYRPDNSIVLQYLLSQGVAETRDPFNESSHEIGLGLKREVSRGTVFEIGIIENAITADNSPDFGIHMGLRYRF